MKFLWLNLKDVQFLVKRTKYANFWSPYKDWNNHQNNDMKNLIEFYFVMVF